MGSGHTTMSLLVLRNAPSHLKFLVGSLLTLWGWGKPSACCHLLSEALKKRSNGASNRHQKGTVRKTPRLSPGHCNTHRWRTYAFQYETLGHYSHHFLYGSNCTEPTHSCHSIWDAGPLFVPFSLWQQSYQANFLTSSHLRFATLYIYTHINIQQSSKVDLGVLCLRACPVFWGSYLRSLWYAYTIYGDAC